MQDPIHDCPGGCRITVRVVPRASRSEIAECRPDAIRIRLQAPPVDGKANQALVEFIAEQLSLSRRAVRLVAGETDRIKRLQVDGLNAATVRSRLRAGGEENT